MKKMRPAGREPAEEVRKGREKRGRDFINEVGKSIHKQS
jgi:hypothetical protein